jgi:DNA-binding SARP family transcriptional activator
VDSTTIRLFASPKLLVDLWEMTALRASAAAARTSGDIDRAIELYDAASSLLRGAPLIDVGRLAGFDDEIERARLSHVSALLSAGELRFAQGAARHAASDAERALAVDPYLERAHRLAIAAHLHGHQPGRAVAAVARAQNALDELGVDPEPATAMLMRQAAAWAPAGQGVARAS